MHVDPLLPQLVGAILGILVLGLVLRRFRQPHVVAYLVAGVLLGPFGLAFVDDEQILLRLGSVGVLLLLFFVGMEASPRRLSRHLVLATWALLLQVGASVAIAWPMTVLLGWSPVRALFVGFAVSLSSSGLVLRLLEDAGELRTDVGQSVLSILLLQDVAVVPMMIVLQVLGGGDVPGNSLSLMVTGGALLLGFMVWILQRGSATLRLLRAVENDHEMQVFAALAVCLGLALVSGVFGLSPAIGAFCAGLLVSSATETRWIRRHLESFRVVFVAFFFVSIGMLADLRFIADNWIVIGSIAALVLALNTGINAGIMRLFGFPWKQGLYAGALLSEVGEFSFVLASVARGAGILQDYAYRLTVSVICVSLVTCPLWIRTVGRATRPRTESPEAQGEPADAPVRCSSETAQ